MIVVTLIARFDYACYMTLVSSMHALYVCSVFCIWLEMKLLRLNKLKELVTVTDLGF